MDGIFTPTSQEGAAEGLAAAAANASAVRFRGGGTKLDWGPPTERRRVELRLERLDRTLEHNPGDLTAIFEAGVPIARIQNELGAHGQMLALDPPLGAGRDAGATIGGVIATADSGPLRHRYGAPRDLIIGITVALSDGTVARAGGKVIKNVAGYDLAKLFTGSFGTLGAILSVSVRLHPLLETHATALGACEDSDLLRRAAKELAAAPLELDALDIAWRAGRGGILARASGPAAVRRSLAAADVMRRAGLEHVDVTENDAELWARQRSGQRSAERAIVRVTARPSELPAVLAAADRGAGTVVGRAALGISYVALDPAAVATMRDALPAGAGAVLLDGPPELRAGFEVWGPPPTGAKLELMQRIKLRFDPAAVCNPGLFVGGI
jgi:glycolate oxidase FAD binding subunit